MRMRDVMTGVFGQLSDTRTLMDQMRQVSGKTSWIILGYLWGGIAKKNPEKYGKRSKRGGGGIFLGRTS